MAKGFFLVTIESKAICGWNVLRTLSNVHLIY